MSAVRRTWRDLRERLSDLGDFAEEMAPDMDWGRARFLYAIIAPMAEDAALLARDLEGELYALAAEHGVSLPRMELGGGGPGE
ncbi:hypothetical protein ABTX81_17415 [Kitasatospora sp. NPDC097605]|uniref:hypothetical protein n=1 Tax=Kitasatospora sp. NPDC097605 TaxID=3157226 RepID=UPI0033257383